MKNRPLRLGLVVEGNTTQSAVLRLDKLPEELGPVKSTVLSTARRLTNTLRGGYPVADYEGLADTRLILLKVPDASLPRVISEIARSSLAFKELAFLLCESWHSLDSLSELRDKGAAIASILNLPIDRKDWFVVDGDSRAIRPTKRFIETNRCRVTELNRKGKHFLFASELLANALPVPLFVAAQQSLREAGFTGNLLTSVLEQMLLRTVRDLMRGGKVRWGGPLLECSPEVCESHLAEVSGAQPELGKFISENLSVAHRMMDARK